MVIAAILMNGHEIIIKMCQENFLKEMAKKHQKECKSSC